MIRQEFLELLERSRAPVREAVAASGPNLKGEEFEHLVFLAVQKVADQLFPGVLVEQTGKLSFPDITVGGSFGIEVKLTSGSKWSSPGNSVLENTRVKGVEEIFIFFGKMSPQFESRFAPYQECLVNVIATHSPRYFIDMSDGHGPSIFEKMKTNYEAFRNSDQPIVMLKDYYRSQLKPGDSLWWIDDSEDAAASPILSLLAGKQKAKFVLEVFVLFPSIFHLPARVRFTQPAVYLLKEYNAISPALRDLFSGGGQGLIQIDSATYRVPRIVFQLFSHAPKILKTLESMPTEKLEEYWNCPIGEDRLETWLNLLDAGDSDLSVPLELGVIFRGGLAATKKN